MQIRNSLSFFKSQEPKIGTIYILSGPSGVGKTSIIERIVKENKNIERVLSYTTRPMRKGEVNHQSYHFISYEEFQEKLKNNEFIKHIEYCGNYYGFGLSENQVKAKISSGLDLIFDMQYTDIPDMKKKFPTCKTILVTLTSIDALKVRMLKRGETDETIQKRMLFAKVMLEQATLYDYTLVNDDDRLDESVKALHFIIKSNRDERINCSELVYDQGSRKHTVHALTQ